MLTFVALISRNSRVTNHCRVIVDGFERRSNNIYIYTVVLIVVVVVVLVGV